VLIALLVCLIPTTIGGLLSAIGISGIDRLIRRNVMATSGRAVEAAGDIDVLLLDKTGTITIGNRMASDFVPAPGVTEWNASPTPRNSPPSPTKRPKAAASWCSPRRSSTPRPRSRRAARHLCPLHRADPHERRGPRRPQHPQRRGGLDQSTCRNSAASIPPKSPSRRSRLSRRPHAARRRRGRKVLGVVELKDVVKGGIKERFAQLRKMGIRTVMITGDNPMTAAAIAAEAGVDDFMAQATPEDKLKRIRAEQAAGHLVAMTGDGTNDAPALAQADVGVAMNTGTQAAREAGNMVDLDSNPTKLIEIVEIGKQLLMTRGSLTTFSIANDIAKYFAIIPRC
jgi:K+-transporting ATPase ATPase B chain